MDITPLVPSDRKIIQAYGNGGFRIGGRRYSGPVLIFADRVMAWTVEGFAALSGTGIETHIAPILTEDPPVELLIVGCGKRHQRTPDALNGMLSKAGIAVESMATGPACRTFNILLTDGRRVAAALLPVD